MAETLSKQLWSERAHDLAKAIEATFAATKSERARLHAMSFDGHAHGAFPDDALYLLNKSFADLFGITTHTPTSLAPRREEFIELLRTSPVGEAWSLREWLREVAGCPNTALFLERADYLRLVLLQQLQPSTQSQSAA
jgi:hypothetical protein